MPTNSKKPTPKKSAKNSSSKLAPKSLFKNVTLKIQEYTKLSPHRSFRLTKRRDYIRPLELPHPIIFIMDVSKLLWTQRRIFLPLMLFYAVFYAVLVGVASQETYGQVSASIEEAGTDVLSEAGSSLELAGLTLVSIASGALDGSSTEAQQIFGGLLTLLAWLTTIWLLRNILAGNKVRVRDGLYNAGAPLVSTTLIALVIVVQLLPVALATIGYAAATSSGLIANGGVEAMLFWVAAGLLGLLSLYWISTSIFASVIVTLPGMYPMVALRNSREILLGRRLKLLFRLIWMAVFILTIWVVVMIPVIMFDGWLKWALPAIEWLPVVPIFILILSTFSVFWIATYVYLLYRKVVDYESA